MKQNLFVIMYTTKRCVVFSYYLILHSQDLVHPTSYQTCASYTTAYVY